MDCFPSAQLPVVTPGMGGLTQSGTAAPLDAEASRAHRLPQYHLPTETRVPFYKLTGTTGPQNNKQIHGVVFVKDKRAELEFSASRRFWKTFKSSTPNSFCCLNFFSHFSYLELPF